MPEFPIDYTKYSYEDLLTFADETAKILLPEWTSRNVLDVNWVTMQIVCGVMEIGNFYTNYAVNESVPSSVRTPEGFYRLARSRGYYPTTDQSGETTLTVTRTDTSGSQTVFEGTACTTDTGVSFSVKESVTFGIGEATKTIDVIYGTYQTAALTTAFTANSWETFNVPLTNIVTGTIKVLVNEGGGDTEYTIVDSLNLSTSTDDHVMLMIEDDGSTSFRFGDDVNGNIPAVDADISYSCVLSPSTRIDDNYGNIGENLITAIIGFTASSITHAASTGGFRYPTLEEFVRDLALYEASSMRAVTDRDHEFLARQVNGVGIAKAKTGGFNTTLIYCADSNGIPISAAKRIEVESFVQARAVDGKDVEARSVVQITIDITLTITAKSNQKNSQLETVVTDAITELFTGLASQYVTSLDEGKVYKYILDIITDRVERVSVIKLAKATETGVNDIDLDTTEVISEGTTLITVTGGLSD